MRFRLAGRNDEMNDAYLSVIPPDQVEGGVKDMVYQTTGIAHAVIPDTSGIAFFIRMRFPIRLGMTLWISSKAIPARGPE